MRVTRYINGKKIVNSFENKPLIENNIVASTIEKVNRRLNSTFNENEGREK